MAGARRSSPRVKGVDVLVAALIVLFALLAVALHASVRDLGEMATGIRDTGRAIQASGQATAREIRLGGDTAADTLAAVPLVGAEAGRAVRDATERSATAVERESRSSGARLVDAGSGGQRDARRVASLVGWLAFLVPTVLLLIQWLSIRRPMVREVRSSTSADGVAPLGPAVSEPERGS